jgi:hypothetical protein
VENGRSRPGHLREKRLDPDGENQRTVHHRGESSLEESLQGQQQAEHRPDDGRKNTGRMPEKQESGGRTNPLLDGRKDRGEPVLQLPRLRLPSERPNVLWTNRLGVPPIALPFPYLLSSETTAKETGWKN